MLEPVTRATKVSGGESSGTESAYGPRVGGWTDEGEDSRGSVNRNGHR